MIIDARFPTVSLSTISAGKAMELYNILGLDKLDCSVALLKNVSAKASYRQYDIIKIDQVLDLTGTSSAYVDPGITVNIIKTASASKSASLPPERITNVIRCKNPRCITR